MLRLLHKKIVKIIPIVVILILLSLSTFIQTMHAASSPWIQSDWSGGSGQTSWSAINQFSSSAGVTASTNVTANITWYNSSWIYRRIITIDHTKVGATLTNYPLLVNLTSDINLSSHAQTNGNDILFTSSDNVTKLSHEIEHYNSATGELEAWVKIPTLSATTDTIIYMYYGNSGASNQQNINSTWDSSYIAVYHLGENNGQIHDSTSNALNSSLLQLTKEGSASGQIDGADLFQNSGDNITIPNNAVLSPSNDITTEAWISPAQSSAGRQTILTYGANSSPYYSYKLDYSSTVASFSWTNTTSSNWSAYTSSSLPTNSFSYIAGVHIGNSLRIYLNGSDNTQSVPTTTGTLFQADNTFKIGVNQLSSIIDEVRISNVARSAGYFTTTYNNLNTPTTFETIGSEISKSTGTTGSLTSSIFDTGTSSNFGTLTFTDTIPSNTSVSVYVRTGNNPDLSDATAFSSCTAISSGSNIAGNNCVTNTNRYIQYKISLTSNDFVNTPTFSSISLGFSTSSAPAGNGFVQRQGSTLYLNGNPFKFAGSNIYWLGLTDHPQTLTTISSAGSFTDYPTTYEIDTALQTGSLMGANVIRTFGAFSVGCSKCIEPSLGTFNDTAFNTLDYAIQQAHTYGIKLMLPLVDDYHYYNGGKHTFTDWESDNNENHFYTNAAVISDFEAYISHVLNHINTYTGIAYKNDPTIMAWETGNELSTETPSWAQTISTYIKGIDTNHLIADGHRNPTSFFLTNNNVDLYTDHFYPPSIATMSSDATTTNSYNKVFYIGEYDWTEANGGDTLSSFLNSIEGNNNIAGDLFWSIFPQNDSYGFITGDQYTLHYPGDTSAMATRSAALRTHAYTQRGISIPAYSTPGTPYLFNITDTSTGVNLWWRGDPNAASYTVERSSDGGTTWKVLQTGLTDNSTPWNDITANANIQYTYRVKALNKDGVAGTYSNTQIWPVNVVQNGSFENSNANNSFAYWSVINNNGASESITQDTSTSIDGNNSAKINVTNVGSPSLYYNMQFYQKNINLTSGKTYSLSFWAKADSSRNIDMALQQAVSPYTVYYEQNSVALTTTWQQFTYTFKASTSDNTANLYFNVSQTTGNIWIDNVSVTPQNLYTIKSTPTSSGTALSWNTTLSADSKVDYGLLSTYGHTSAASDTGGVTLHANAITGLASCATFHYRTKSIDTLQSSEIDSGDNTFLTGGCTGNATVSTSSAQQITTALGGNVSLLDTNLHGMSMVVPSSFGPSDANFQINQVDKTAVINSIGQPSGKQVVSGYIYETQALTDVNSITSTFNKPISITMSYGSTDASGSYQNDLAIYYYHNGQWSQLDNCSVNTTAHTVTCTTTGFSVFALMGDQTNNSSNTSNAAMTPSCSQQQPGSQAPWLYGALPQTDGSMKLYFTDAQAPYDHYTVTYGTQSNNYTFGLDYAGGVGTRIVTIGSLLPDTTYYFKVRGGNGCAAGNWSNELSATTKSLIQINSLRIISSTLTPESNSPDLSSSSLNQTQITNTSNACTVYTVKSGDGIWQIAKNQLGDGSKFTEIKKLNEDTYPSLKTSNSLEVGWKLTITCNKQSNQPTNKHTESTTGYDLSIKVINPQNQPVAGAKVTLHSTPRNAVTDKDGVASFANVEKGNHTVLLAYNNYKGQENINLTGDVKKYDLTIKVQPTSITFSTLAIEIITGLMLLVCGLVTFVTYQWRKLNSIVGTHKKTFIKP